MKEKYFIPKIEELFIGYETEEIFFGEFSSFFTPCSLESLEAHYLSDKTQSTPVIIDSNKLAEIILLNDLPRSKGGKGMLGIYRTPYLTKEQIEKKGWKLVWNEGVFDSEEFSFEYKNYFLQFCPERNNNISIYRVGKDKIFSGKIKCINQFRNILKYLCINT